MPRGITKRRPRTVAALLDAALELFAEQGYGATSIPDICDRAGLTKGAFYSNFPNKEALFLALLDRSWDQRARWLRRDLPGNEARGAMGADRSVMPSPGAVDRQWTLLSTEFSLHAIRHPEIAVLLVRHEQRVRSDLAVIVAEMLERQGRMPTLPVLDLARMIVAIIEGSDIQLLTDAAGGAEPPLDQGPRAVSALLVQFSKPIQGNLESAESSLV